MANVTLDLRLHAPDRMYAPGEKVHGVVHVDVKKTTNCNDLDLAFVLNQTSEHGTTRTLRIRKLSLFSTRDWQAGAHDYPFDFAAPNWPPAHKGEMVDFQWTLTAVADLPMALNVEVSVPVRIEIAPGHGLIVTHLNPGDPSRTAGKQVNVGGLVCLLLGGGLGSVGALVDNNKLLVTGGVFGTVALLYILFRWLRVRAIGEPQLVVDHPGTDGDAKLQCTLWIKQGAKVEGVDCTLLVTERHRISHETGGAASSTTTHTHTVLKHRFALQSAADGTYRGELSLSELGKLPYTYSTDPQSTGIGWSIIPVVRRKGGAVYAGDIAVLSARPASGPGAEKPLV